MNNVMEYKGYHAKIEFSADDNAFFGKIMGIDDSVIFEGDTVRQLTKMFHQAVDDYIEECISEGKEPQKEYKGSFNVRLNPARHKRAALVAIYQSKTLNQLVCDAVDEYCASVMI